LPLPPAAAGAARLRLTGDAADFDNVSWLAVPEAERIVISYLGPDSPDDPNGLRYYLQRVFPATPRRRVELASPPPGSGLSAASLETAAFAVIATSLSPKESAAVRGWLAGGQTALLVLTGAESAPTLSALLDQPQTRLTEAGGDFALLGQIDFADPLFAPFVDPRFSDFTRIHFWKHRRWEVPPSLPVHVLAAFDDGSPALARVSVGRGALLVLASGWSPADSQLALSSKFPPLMQRILEGSGAGAPARFQFRTGDVIPPPVLPGATITWRKPDGTEQIQAANAPFTATDMPGLYAASAGGRTRRFAVNLPLEESRTGPLAPDELARLGVPLASTAAVAAAPAPERRLHLQQAERERRQKLWRWLIVGALGVTLAEILLSGSLMRLVKTTEATA
jgi:hypothetical protein